MRRSLGGLQNPFVPSSVLCFILLFFPPHRSWAAHHMVLHLKAPSLLSLSDIPLTVYCLSLLKRKWKSKTKFSFPIWMGEEEQAKKFLRNTINKKKFTAREVYNHVILIYISFINIKIYILSYSYLYHIRIRIFSYSQVTLKLPEQEGHQQMVWSSNVGVLRCRLPYGAFLSLSFGTFSPRHKFIVLTSQLLIMLTFINLSFFLQIPTKVENVFVASLTYNWFIQMPYIPLLFIQYYSLFLFFFMKIISCKKKY